VISPVLAALNFLIKILLGDSSEWEGSGQHNVKENTQGPHINWLAVILMLSDDFWAHVAWGAAENFEPLMVSNYYGKAKVY